MKKATLETPKNDAVAPPALEVPASPKSQEKRWVPPEPLTTANTVTPTLSPKRRRLDLNSFVNTPTDTATATPSYAELYGDEESQKTQVRVDAWDMPTIPVLQSHHRPGLYKRRHSVTKFSLQATGNMSVLEAARMTLEKMRQESMRKQNGNDSGKTKDQADLQSILRASLRH